MEKEKIEAAFDNFLNPEESKSSESSKIHKDSSVSSTGNNSEYVNVAPEF